MKELTPEELRQWNGIILEALYFFDSFCRTHRLTYYAVGGTAIGAVRHHGIIPWDDDIDVAMPRPDYDRFVSLCPSSLPSAYRLVTPYTDADYNLPFAKLIDTRTVLVERSAVPCRIGLFIDIFPLDAASDDSLAADCETRRYRRLMNRLEAVTARTTFMSRLGLLLRPHEWGRFAVQTAAVFFRQTLRHRYLLRLERIARRHPYGSTQWLTNYGGAYGSRERFPAAYLDGDTPRLPFADGTIPLFPRYHDYLTRIYGDYMQLPPPEKRIPHHTKHIVCMRELTTHDA